MDVSSGHRPTFRSPLQFGSAEALAEHRHLEVLRAAGVRHPRGRRAQRALIERRAQKLERAATDFRATRGTD